MSEPEFAQTVDPSVTCDDSCNIHFGCDCGETVTRCVGGESLFPHGHGEDFGECAYRKSLSEDVLYA